MDVMVITSPEVHRWYQTDEARTTHTARTHADVSLCYGVECLMPHQDVSNRIAKAKGLAASAKTKDFAVRYPDPLVRTLHRHTALSLLSIATERTH
jgi:hypothetical protein